MAASPTILRIIYNVTNYSRTNKSCATSNKYFHLIYSILLQSML
ncbi:hypothetical protein HMPREF1595_02556 [Escherichia coli 907672]|nr:hypothetical protein HMPREF1595_02556 [Escherichia coli 907672]